MDSSKQDVQPTDSEDGRKDADSLLNKMNSAMSPAPAQTPARVGGSAAQPAPGGAPPAPFKPKKATFTRTIHEFAALGSSGLLYPAKPAEFSPSNAAPETPDVSIYQSIDNAIEARDTTQVQQIRPAQPVQPVQPQSLQIPTAEQQFSGSQSASAPQNPQNPQYPDAQYPQFNDAQFESSQLAQVHSQYPEVQFDPQPVYAPQPEYEQPQEPYVPAEQAAQTHEHRTSEPPKGSGRNLASSIAAINRAKEIKKTTALSKALERDKAWLEAKDLPAERDAIDAQLLAPKARDFEPASAEVQHVTRTDFAAIIDKTGEDLPNPTIFQKAMEFGGKHPLPIGLSVVILLAVIGFVDLQSLQAASHQVEKGAELLAHGDTKEAIVALDKAVALNGTSSDAYLFRGKAYARLGNTDKALANYKNALKFDSKSLEALSESALICLSLDQNKEAAGYFQDYMKFAGGAPKPTEIFTGLGRAYLGMRQYELALEQFNKAVESKHDDPEAILLRATCYQRMGRPVEAILDCSNAIKLNPKFYNGYVLRAHCYQINNNKPKAMADFAQAISLDPKNPRAFVSRGEFYAAQKDFDRALQDFSKAIALNPKDELAYENRAKLYLAKGDKAKAEQDYNALAAVTGFKPTVTYTVGLANLYMQSANWQKAIALLKKAQAKDVAHDADYSMQLADCYGGLKQYAKAASACEKVVASQPLNSNAVMKHGQYSYLAGNKITGRADLFKAIELDPKNANAYLQRGNYYLAEKQIGTAADDFKQALKLAPELTAATENLAFCQSQVKTVKVAHGDAPEADSSSLSKAEAKEIADSSDAKALQNKGYDALKAGRIPYALAALTRAVQLSPNSSTARRYLAHTMVVAGDGVGAYQQLLAWERLESVSATDEINLARALMTAGDSANAKVMLTHIISKFGSECAVLLNVATLCAAAHYTDEATLAINAGAPVSTASDRAQFAKIQATLGTPNPVTGQPQQQEGPRRALDGRGKS